MIPALQLSSDRYSIEAVVAQSRRRISVNGIDYQVASIDDANSDMLDGIDLIYIGVAKRASGATIEHLVDLAGDDVTFLVDTPVLNIAHLAKGRALVGRPLSWAAEDCATLPWLGVIDAAVAAGRCGPPAELLLDQSAYRYHGFAMMRRILRSPLRAARKRNLPKGSRLDVRMANGTLASLVTPRNYDSGHFEIVTSDGAVISDDPSAATDGLLLAPIVEAGWCQGFDLGGITIQLNHSEQLAAGAGWQSESVTQRMDDLKRAGLVRMLLDIDEKYAAATRSRMRSTT